MIFSKAISIIFHPVFAPFISILLTCYVVQKTIIVDSCKTPNILISVFIVTIVIPLLATLYMLKKKYIASFEMREKKERVYALRANSLLIGLGYLFTNKIYFCQFNKDLSTLLKLEFLAVIFSIYIASEISKHYKISLHLIGFGGVCAVIMRLTSLAGDLLWLLCIFILLSGVVATARRYAGAHTRKQIYFGFFLGFIIQFLFFYL